MNCPACDHQNPDGNIYCAHCRMSFGRLSLFFVRLLLHLAWILRRANAGFFAGFVAWFFIPALSRVLSAESTPIVHFIATGVLGGAFLGAVDGMVEESTPKTVQGGVLGGLGGAVGGGLFGYFQAGLPAEQIMWALFFFWGIVGAFIGSVSALLERKPAKIFAGAISGLMGGGIGGALGYFLYAFLSQEHDPGVWYLRRLYEGFSGGIVGLTLWFFLGFAERFYIFKRRPLGDAQHKTCDHCRAQNPLNSWYCGKCGSVLQTSAPPAKLNLSRYLTLDQVSHLLRFLSRLSVTTGVIAGLVIFTIFVGVNPLLAIVAVIAFGVFSYFLQLFFSSCAEALQIFMALNSNRN